MADMRGLTSLVGGAALLGVAAWIYLAGGAGATMLGLVAAALFLLYRAWQGQSFTEAGDFTTAIDLVTDPRGAMIDLATDQATEWLDEARSASSEDQPAFDPDAALARYMANRPPIGPQEPAQPLARRQFGRKGV